MISEATYQGKTVKLNDPIRTSEVPTKKFKVCIWTVSVQNKDGKDKLIQIKLIC